VGSEGALSRVSGVLRHRWTGVLQLLVSAQPSPARAAELADLALEVELGRAWSVEEEGAVVDRALRELEHRQREPLPASLEPHAAQVRTWMHGLPLAQLEALAVYRPPLPHEIAGLAPDDVEIVFPLPHPEAWQALEQHLGLGKPLEDAQRGVIAELARVARALRTP
jgi:hypothetical protein